MGHNTSESGTASLEKKDAMRIWLEMKQNGFLTPSPSPAPISTPNKRCKKRGNDMLSRKVELPKPPKIPSPATGLLKELNDGITPSVATLPTPKQCNEKHRIGMPRTRRKMKVAKVHQENRFTKIAAPSGLLNELNPGIINRIRNSEQVFSVIEALVRRDMMGTVNVQSKQTGRVEERFKDNVANECPDSLSGSGRLRICSLTPSRLLHVESEVKEEAGNLSTAVRRVQNEDVKIELNSSISLSTSSDNASSPVLNEESANTASGSSISQEVATVASQWLQFLQQDITGRLAALKCSRMRVQDVIQTELPFLVAKEFSCKQDNEQLSAAGCPMSMTMDMHRTKWTTLFDQMNHALNEEANNLQLWLNQLIEMHARNSDGFCFLNWFARHFLQQPGNSDCGTRKF